MKNCPYCGAEMEDGVQFCASCGANQSAEAQQTATVTAEPVEAPLEKHTGLTVLGFFFPLIALIMWLVWKDSEYSKAMAVGKGGLMSVSLSPIVGLVCYLLLKDKYKDIAKACGICAIVGVVLYVLSYVFGIVLGVLIALIGTV